MTTLLVNPQSLGDAFVVAVKVSSSTSHVSSLSGGGASSWAKLESYNDGSHDNELWLGTVTTRGPPPSRSASRPV